jgi:hypothetical protein
MEALRLAAQRARSGLRRDVRELIEAFHESRVLVPLARSLANIPLGGPREVNGEIQISPHLIPTGDGRKAICLFTHEAPLARIVGPNGWTTDGGPLQLATLPSLVGLRLGFRAIDNWNVTFLVIDPGAPSELRLTSIEVGKMLDGKAIPLRSYAAHAPLESATLQSEPAPSDAVNALEACLRTQAGVLEYRFERVFDPERQLEPNLMIRLRVEPDVLQEQLVRVIGSALQDKVPGIFVDVRFDL